MSRMPQANYPNRLLMTMSWLVPLGLDSTTEQNPGWFTNSEATALSSCHLNPALTGTEGAGMASIEFDHVVVVGHELEAIAQKLVELSRHSTRTRSHRVRG
ncbi:hypothetical protein [Arthrobacter sp. TWP1-1]|uniref:hypothetical protein n=1 Tax=Arthrobacter sp. TWP1-1 TaxID=2804568 RepID=UPI003CE80C5E